MYLPFLKVFNRRFTNGTSSNYLGKQLILRQILTGKYRNVNSKVCAKFGGVENNNFFLFPPARIL
jgi:hypothetical protein